MDRNDMLRVPISPGLKEIVRELADGLRLSTAEFVREAVSARVQEYLDIDDVELRQEIARRSTDHDS